MRKTDDMTSPGAMVAAKALQTRNAGSMTSAAQAVSLPE
jgi:hypothetical protein